MGGKAMEQHWFVRVRATRTVHALCIVVALVLSACGGGSGSHDLTVGFSYTGAVTDLFAPARATAQFTGLEGNRPHCAVTAGTLPPGVSVAGDCSVIGAPTQTGVFTATVTLT